MFIQFYNYLNSYSMRGGTEDMLAIGMCFHIMSFFLPLVQIKDFIKKKKLIQHVVLYIHLLVLN